MAETHKPTLSIVDSVKLLGDSRLWRIFGLGAASGFPFLLIGSCMTLWLTQEGFSRSAVGLFGIVFAVYTFNFMWAPLIDHIRIPFIGVLGKRRSWILMCQLGMILFCLTLVSTGPAVSLFLTALACLGIAIFSATQDLAIDAYRITIIEEDEPELIGHGAAMAVSGWWTGVSVPAVFALWVVDYVGWPLVYFGLACTMCGFSALVLWVIKEPPISEHTSTEDLHIGLVDRLGGVFSAYFEAVAEFFRRNGFQLALGLLLFVFLFKIGEAFLGKMVLVFYTEVGYTNEEIGTYSKGLGWIVTIVCAITAGILMGRFGVIRGLIFAGTAMAATNLLFAWIALEGPDIGLLVFAVMADGITSSWSTVAFVTFISYYTSHVHAATQYAALASIGNSSRTTLAALSGMLVDSLAGNWALFFVMTALMVLPSFALLAFLTRVIKSKGVEPSASTG